MKTDALAQGLLSAFTQMVPQKLHQHAVIAGGRTYPLAELRQRADDCLIAGSGGNDAGALLHALIDHVDASQLARAQQALAKERKAHAELRMDVAALMDRLKSVPGTTVPLTELLEELAAILG